MAQLTRYLIALGCILCFASYAAAHSLKLFVQESQEEISGQVYFSGGIPAQQAQVLLHGADGHVLLQVLADKQGHFELPRLAGEAVSVSANSQDGHVAKWPLKAVTVEEPPVQPSNQTVQVLDALALEQIVRDAVAKEIAPLKLALQQQQDKAKLSDLLGGVGIIFGLAGIYLWWRSRR